jgi:hypothetical protein
MLIFLVEECFLPASSVRIENAIKVLSAPAEKDGHYTLAALLRVTTYCIKSCIGSRTRPNLADVENRSNSAAQPTARAPKVGRLDSHAPSGEIITAPSQTAKFDGAQRKPAVLLQEHLRAHRVRRLQSLLTLPPADPIQCGFALVVASVSVSSDRSKAASTNGRSVARARR